jgi:Short C-terminal domain
VADPQIRCEPQVTETPPPTAAARPGPALPRRRIVLARALTVLAIVLVVVTILANFVKREALDASRFRITSRALIANPPVRNQIADTLVDELYANVDVSAALQQRLPENLKGLSGPIAGAARDVADRSAQRLLERPRVQDAFVDAASAAQGQYVAILDGNTGALETSGGNVVLDVRPLVLELGDRFSFAPDLETRIPEGRARVTILKSNQLKTAQKATKALRFLADWIWVLALAAAAAAIWLVPGRRRIEVRANAIGLVIAGFLVLVVRALAGRYFVDRLVVSDSVRPAVASAYNILTDLLSGAGWTAIIGGVVALAGVWLTGARSRAVATRRELAPYLRRPELAYGVLVLAYLLLLWWRPTPQFGFLRDVIVFFALAVLGLEVLRRQAAREFPDAEPTDPLSALRNVVSRMQERSASGGPTEDLERLARLHSDGALDDAEFAAAKAQLLRIEGRPADTP